MTVNSNYLWVVPKWPLPAEDGARLATVHLLREATKAGKRVTLCAYVSNEEKISVDEAREALGVEEAVALERPRVHAGVTLSRFTALLVSALAHPLTPFTLLPFVTSAANLKVTEMLDQTKYDVIVYDGMHGAGHGHFLGKYRRPKGGAVVVYRAHNRESVLWKQATRLVSRGLRPFFWLQYLAVTRFENSLASIADGVATVSDDDNGIFQALSRRSTCIPIGLPFPEAPTALRETGVILFVGRLDWPPNQEGLTWFLREVWPSVSHARPDLSFHIIGGGHSDWLRNSIRDSRVFYHGRVASLDEWYERAMVCVSPIFSGSGARVKAVEAARYGRPLVSTPLGAEGSGLDGGCHFFRAETREEWITMLVSLSFDELSQMARNGFDQGKRERASHAVASHFLSFVDSLQVGCSSQPITEEDNRKGQRFDRTAREGGE